LNPVQLQWHDGSAGLSECNVASAASAAGGPQGVVLSFGVREQPGPGGEWHVKRLHQVTLTPAAAAGLGQMLSRLLADLDKPRRG